MKRLWVRLTQRHKIVQQATVPCEDGQVKEALLAALKEFDAPAPVWLPKHQREMDEFRHTWFPRSDFMESVSFDRLEIELLDEEGAKRRSPDPRNAF